MDVTTRPPEALGPPGVPSLTYRKPGSPGSWTYAT